MEEVDQESMKHMCKLCDKSFSCERLLGGHMRLHMMINSSDQNKMENTSSVFDKLCEKCGKGFQSWKALFGHMKCHSTKLLSNKNKSIASFTQDSCTSHSNNENPDSKKHRIKRSRSRNKRYMVASTTTSSSISMNVHNSNSNQISSNNAIVSEIEQEQEDVAMSLMMLSRDMGKWGNELESSYLLCNSSVLVNLGKVQGKDLTKNGSKMKKLVEPQASLDSFGKSKLGFIKSSELDLGFGEYENSSKRKYDCVTCNKSFHSSQALGGHKASHKKLDQGGFDTKIRNKNKIEHKPVLDHDQTTKGYESKACDIHQEPSNFNLGVGLSKKKTVVVGAYECPICFKIFASGQALGGHKRAHLISEAKRSQELNTNVTKKADEHLQETRGFFDLNMPPEEEMNMTSSTTEYKSYYLKDSNDQQHNHESRLLGLLSTS